MDQLGKEPILVIMDSRGVCGVGVVAGCFVVVLEAPMEVSVGKVNNYKIYLVSSTPKLVVGRANIYGQGLLFCVIGPTQFTAPKLFPAISIANSFLKNSKNNVTVLYVHSETCLKLPPPMGHRKWLVQAQPSGL